MHRHGGRGPRLSRGVLILLVLHELVVSDQLSVSAFLHFLPKISRPAL